MVNGQFKNRIREQVKKEVKLKDGIITVPKSLFVEILSTIFMTTSMTEWVYTGSGRKTRQCDSCMETVAKDALFCKNCGCLFNGIITSKQKRDL